MNYCPNCFMDTFDGSVCSYCHYDVRQDRQKNIAALRPSTVLNKRYIIGRILGSGGFGITYKAYDTLNNLICAVKEYAPKSYFIREATVLKPTREGETVFQLGKQSFLEEAATLRKLPLELKSVVRIFDDFDANNTAYYAMKLVEGTTLKRLVAESRDKKLNVSAAVKIFTSAGNTLQAVHQRTNLLHRDVSPENIMIGRDRRVTLIDFGNAKSIINQHQRDQFVGLKHGYAAYEQYTGMNQGAWTDVYALAATFYYCVTGAKLPAADKRAREHASYKPVKQLIPGCSPYISDAIDDALIIDYKNRIQTVEEFVRRINSGPESVSARSSHVSEKRYNSSAPWLSLISDTARTKRWVLPADKVVTVGKSSAANIAVSDLGQISRAHFKIRYDSGKDQIFIMDISANGTSLNGVPLEKNRIYRVKENDTIALSGGLCRLKVGRNDES